MDLRRTRSSENLLPSAESADLGQAGIEGGKFDQDSRQMTLDQDSRQDSMFESKKQDVEFPQHEATVDESKGNKSIFGLTTNADHITFLYGTSPLI